jgi:CRISPR type I-E-associated protein CasB/Cse2
MTDKEAQRQRFFVKLDGESKHQKTKLKRACGKMLNQVDTDTMLAFYQAAPNNISLWSENRWFLAACVYCLYGEDAKKGEPMPEVFAHYVKVTDASESTQRRFANLLDTSWDEDGFMASKLVRLIKMLNSKGFVVDADDLLRSLLNWNYDSRSEQKKWAKCYTDTLENDKQEEQ